MSESSDTVDFKILKRSGFRYSELDLSGAGWCMCLPRDGGYLPVPASEPETNPSPEPSVHDPEPGQTWAEVTPGQPEQDGTDEVDNLV